MYVKNCLDCGVELLGKRRHAKFCSRACKDRAYKKADPEKFLKQARVRYAADREKVLERNRASRKAELEKFRERDRAYRAADLEKFRERSRANYAAHREKYQEEARVRYSYTGTSTVMMLISNVMKKLREE
jgi:hypothetical protein